ncbi:MAG TPA: hypothetical protein EYH01_04645 [Campylobacterales bacterium]|nr:hypothetical protein [Campylobacterales bacterium]
MQFLTLEGGNLAIGLFVILAALFVTTRSFMSKNAFKVGFTSVVIIATTLILTHYYFTTDRMHKVEEGFNIGKIIICENKMYRNISRSQEISKNKGWDLKDNILFSPKYSRTFHTARCVIHYKNKP